MRTRGDRTPCLQWAAVAVLMVATSGRTRYVGAQRVAVAPIARVTSGTTTGTTASSAFVPGTKNGFNFECGVTSAADSGAGTLRECISEANIAGGNALITISWKLHGDVDGRLELLSALPAIRNPVTSITIKGEAPTKLFTISAPRRNSINVIEALTNVDLTLQNLIIEGGNNGVVMGGTAPPDRTTVSLKMANILVAGAKSNGISLTGVAEGDLTNCQIDSNGGDGLEGLVLEGLMSGYRYTFAKSSFSSNTGNGINLINMGEGELAVSGCSVSYNGDEGLDAASAIVSLTSSKFDFNEFDGFECAGCFISAFKSTFSSNGSDGIEINAGSEMVVAQCTIDNNGSDGIDAHSSNIDRIEGTSMSQNGANGLQLLSQSTTGLIAKSKIVNNGGYAMRLEPFAAVNVVRKCKLYGNEMGFVLSDGLAPRLAGGRLATRDEDTAAAAAVSAEPRG